MKQEAPLLLLVRRVGVGPTLPFGGSDFHVSACAGNHGFVPRPSTAAVVPRAMGWGAVWSEVKEEGRIELPEAHESSTGPGDMSGTRLPAAALSRRPTTENGCRRTSATGQSQSLTTPRTFRALPVARSALEPLR